MPGMMKKNKRTVMYKDGGKVGSCGGKKMKYKTAGKCKKKGK